MSFYIRFARLLLTVAASLAMLQASCGAAARGEPVRGAFGVTIAILAEGIMGPAIRSASVVAVEPTMPAQGAGIASGGAVLGVDGTQVAGGRAADLAALVLGPSRGQRLDALLARPDGTLYRVRLVAE